MKEKEFDRHIDLQSNVPVDMQVARKELEN
jgi:hypothetical protein